jgi:hypothetical protein
MEPHASEPRSDWAPAAIVDTVLVIVVALAFRLLFVAETTREALFRTPPPGLDVDLHWQAARMLRSGAPVQLEWMQLSAPVHALLLAAEQWLFGESMSRLRVLSAVLGALTWGALHRVLLARTASRASALIVALVAAAMPTLVYFDATLLKSSFELTCLVAVIALAIVAEREDRGRRLAAIGAGVGLCLATVTLSQRSALVLSALVLAHLLLLGARSWRRRVGLAIPAAAVLAAALFGFAERGLLSGPLRFACLPTGGIHLRIGMQPGGTGIYSPLPGVPAMPYGHTFVGRMLAEVEEGRPLTPAQADAHHLARALLWLRHDPLAATQLMLHKARLFLSDYEVKDNDSLPALRTRFRELRSPFGWGTALVLAALGILRLVSLRMWRALSLPGAMLLGTLLVTTVGFVTSRYRLHAVVPLLVLSADGVLLLIERARAHGGTVGLWRRWAGPAAVALTMGMLAFLPIDPATAGGLESNAAESERSAEQAALRIAELDALRGDSPDTEVERALRLALLHRDSEAYAKLEALSRQNELRRPEAVRLWITYLLWLGDYDGLDAMLQGLRASAPALFESVSRHHPVLEQAVLDRLVLPGARSAQVLR